MNLALSDHLDTLRAQLVQAEQKLAVAAKAVKVAERTEERASGVVIDLREAIDFERLRRWGDHPDLAALMGTGSDGTMVFHRAVEAIAQSKGFGIGGR
ncbi:MAG: hypothetical protein EON54_06190 [Alcaligenaceae bacterium]|nr:MAG: hypothetical protein EON54_06190 [Alcaligenaceae bacterium]